MNEKTPFALICIGIVLMIVGSITSQQIGEVRRLEETVKAHGEIITRQYDRIEILERENQDIYMRLKELEKK
jgi:hypothetical protein